MSEKTSRTEACPQCGKALRKWSTHVGQGQRALVYAHADGTECRLERATEKLLRPALPTPRR
jgi:hypothetical protein